MCFARPAAACVLPPSPAQSRIAIDAALAQLTSPPPPAPAPAPAAAPVPMATAPPAAPPTAPPAEDAMEVDAVGQPARPEDAMVDEDAMDEDLAAAIALSQQAGPPAVRTCTCIWCAHAVHTRCTRTVRMQRTCSARAARAPRCTHPMAAAWQQRMRFLPSHAHEQHTLSLGCRRRPRARGRAGALLHEQRAAQPAARAGSRAGSCAGGRAGSRAERCAGGAGAARAGDLPGALRLRPRAQRRGRPGLRAGQARARRCSAGC